jgi:putative DNA primase/helicase
MLGEYTCTGDVSMFASPEGGGNTPRLAAARGARLVTCAEIPQTRTFEADVFKRWTGGDSISAMAKHKDPIVFNPDGKVWFAGNHPPRIDAEDDATWNRIRVVPFNVEIPAAEQDRKLRDRMNLDGVFAWAVQGWRDYCAQGLNTPAVCVGAGNAARDLSDRMAESLMELAIVEPGSVCKAEHFRRAYVQRAKEQGEKWLAPQSMNSVLAGRHGFTRQRTKGGFSWRGFRLTEMGKLLAGAGDGAPVDADGPIL